LPYNFTQASSQTKLSQRIERWLCDIPRKTVKW
jgi:hypothetical protein